MVAVHASSGVTLPIEGSGYGWYLTPVDLRFYSQRRWQVLTQYVYQSPRHKIVVPVGFETDFASIPRIAWRIISPTDDCIAKIAIIHDFMYRTPRYPVTKSQADDELAYGMRLLGAPRWKTWIVRRAVQIGGGRAFKKRDFATIAVV